MLEAQIDVSGTLVKLVNVHLDAGPYGPRCHQYQQIRYARNCHDNLLLWSTQVLDVSLRICPLDRHLLAEDKEDIPHLIAGVRRHALDLKWTCELDYTHCFRFV